MRFLPLLFVFSYLLNAQKPVRVDEILTQTENFRLDTTFSYSNIQNQNALSSIQTFQTQNGDFINIPVYLGTLKSNRDYLNMDVTLRYGLTSKLELFASLNGYYEDTKQTIPDTFRSFNNKGLNTFAVGATYLLKKEDKTPALLAGISAHLFEKTRINDEVFTHRFKSYRLYATSYYSVDPVVFMVSASYGILLPKHIGEFERDDGDIFSFSPQVYLALNPYTSINWGIKYTYRSQTKIEGKTVAHSASNLSMTTGLSYELSSNTFISFDAEFLSTASLSQNRFAITLSYKFP